MPATNQEQLQHHRMPDELKIDYAAFRHVDLAKRWREARTVREQARLTEQHESHLETELQMPMFKDLPTGGFKYDWEQFRNHDGLFVFRIKGSDQLKRNINNHVKCFTPEEMDAFCANVFEKATGLLENLSSSVPEDFWTKIAQELGIRTPKGRLDVLVFWDWAMKLVAARIVYGQAQSHGELQSLSEFDTTGDIDMSEQPNTYQSDPKTLSLAAQAVDKFLAIGISKYGSRPKKLKAITRHHTVIAPMNPGLKGHSKKGSALAKKPPKNAEVPNSNLPVKLTPTSDNKVRLRRSAFGSEVVAGGPAWWGSINRPQIPKEISTSRWTPTELQRQGVTAQGSSGQGGAVDDLVIGMHGTTIEDGAKAPQLLTNLAVRTINPLKRRHEDAEGIDGGAILEQPVMKMAKVSDEHADTSVPPSQLDGA